MRFVRIHYFDSSSKGGTSNQDEEDSQDGACHDCDQMKMIKKGIYFLLNCKRTMGFKAILVSISSFKQILLVD